MQDPNKPDASDGLQPRMIRSVLFKKMKYIAYLIFLLCLLGCSTPSAGTRMTFETKGYHLVVTHPCPEGCVSCDKLSLTCVSKTSGVRVIAKGSTSHSTGADGITPARFHGYVFTHDGKTYQITDSGMFTIAGVDGKVIDEENWQTDD